jgi:hypothetical protein
MTLIRRVYMYFVIEAVRLMSTFNSPVPKPGTIKSVSSSTSLPKLELENVDCDIVQWQTFWDQFNSIV